MNNLQFRYGILNSGGSNCSILLITSRFPQSDRLLRLGVKVPSVIPEVHRAGIAGKELDDAAGTRKLGLKGGLTYLWDSNSLSLPGLMSNDVRERAAHLSALSGNFLTLIFDTREQYALGKVFWEDVCTLRCLTKGTEDEKCDCKVKMRENELWLRL